jgi:hypothetical protein
MPLQATSGAASYDAFGGGAAAVIPYIEDVFSTWLYTGNGSTQTITNGIDLSGKGGLTWIKSRSAATDNFLFDTVRGALNEINSNTTDAQASLANSLTAFNSTGFSLGSAAGINVNTATYTSWTFREQPKFFDIVTYTGTGATGQVISHNLGSAPGCIIIKRLSGVAEPYVWHKNLTSTSYALLLNSTSAEFTSAGFLTGTPTSTTFSLKPTTAFDPNGVNGNGSTYVAYIFAHDAGGFGLAGTDNVISCGTYTGNGVAAGPAVTLGYEPQWLMIKGIDNTSNWNIIDNMRGMYVGSSDSFLEANTADVEASANWVTPTSTGFRLVSSSSEVNINNGRYIYIAIRRGPMKVPTDATKVFSNNLETTTTNPQTLTTGFPVDMNINLLKSSSSQRYVLDRLRGGSTTSYTYLDTPATTQETTNTGGGLGFDNNTGIVDSNYWNTSGAMFWSWRRAPSFFDEVCYTGTGSNTTQTHNLAAVPELIIVKGRSGATAWQVYSKTLANTEYVVLNTTAAKATGATRWNSTTPTSSVFSIGTATEVNTSAATYVAYLFATCAGVSKVGSYTGTATTLQVDCGFTAGARFVLIKRTDSTGDWYVWDTARGIIAGNDPYLLLNTTAAEVTSTDYIDTYSAGFEISSTAPAAINASGGTFIFLAIA